MTSRAGLQLTQLLRPSEAPNALCFSSQLFYSLFSFIPFSHSFGVNLLNCKFNAFYEMHSFSTFRALSLRVVFINVSHIRNTNNKTIEEYVLLECSANASSPAMATTRANGLTRSQLIHVTSATDNQIHHAS